MLFNFFLLSFPDNPAPQTHASRTTVTAFGNSSSTGSRSLQRSRSGTGEAARLLHRPPKRTSASSNFVQKVEQNNQTSSYLKNKRCKYVCSQFPSVRPSVRLPDAHFHKTQTNCCWIWKQFSFPSYLVPVFVYLYSKLHTLERNSYFTENRWKLKMKRRKNINFMIGKLFLNHSPPMHDNEG